MIPASIEFDQQTEPIPARMLNEYTYCPRLFYLEYVEGLFAHNQYTREGEARHSRVDRKQDELPSVAENREGEYEKLHARSVSLSSDTYGVTAKLDLVELNGSVATPVDYKRGSPKKLDDGTLAAWEPDRVQLCVQAMVLRENGYVCNEGILFYWETRQRVRVVINEELLQLTDRMIQEAKKLIQSPRIPPPLEDSPKCPKCSLVGICLPDETRHCGLQPDTHDDAPDQLMLFDIGLPSRRPLGESGSGNGVNKDAPVRQLITSRDVRKALYVNTPGVCIGKRGEVIQVKEKTKVLQEVRMKDICQVNVLGPIQISTQAIQELLQAEIPVAYFSMGGWFYGVTQPVGLKNIIWRREQFRSADDPRFCLRFAKQLVMGKLRNQRTLLMRNHIEPSAPSLRFLKTLSDNEVRRATSLEQLLGLEGLGARTYFEQFSGMIKVSESGRQVSVDRSAQGKEETALPHGEPASSWMRFDFTKRNRRPPRDPINALLSLGYSMLTKDLTHTCTAVGLDPYLGFYHQPRFGRPALALDLMEPFRPLIVDSAVLSAINQRMVQPRHFVRAGAAVALTPEGRKAFFQAYEQRLDQLVTHPMFGYRVSYRRLLEIQVRLLARVLLGEILEYPVFVTR